MTTILEALKKLNEDDNIPATSNSDAELEKAREEFTCAVEQAGGLKGKVSVERINGNIVYGLSYEDKIVGEDLRDWTDDIEVDEWEDFDDDLGMRGGIDVVFDEDGVVDIWLDKIIEEDHLENGFTCTTAGDDGVEKEVHFEFTGDYISDYRNDIDLGNYSYYAATREEPEEETIELDGEFKMTATIYFEKK